ncbi:prolyl aminopeptidase [Mycoplasma sp. Mirounga ES2805-ORL]|uniref:prolyl aminopeptidase n=1 Tax=Mycoplasma sp. Mirounga ES2805-ORL TaxID=754514 RepID=UPI00197C8CF1|nr:prolyl aminopeptidase [Mycoplasma sp. Mirounga ES2805-ORL]QSF13601.1 prolyl aminopeptidase [Mycoplasma sp. Mirounga ES2805-ORL]
MYEKYLYPAIEPYEKGFLEVDNIHNVYYEVSGNPKGIPIVYVHGGPGGGTTENCRRYFNPKKYKIILFDQRGCGKSLPTLELEGNTTQNLVNDMEKIRIHLGIDKWILFGGSWGTTLSLVYAIHHPHNVSKMVLRGVFLSRQKDLDWLYQANGAGEVEPIAYEKLVKNLNKTERRDVVNSYFKLMRSPDEKTRNEAFLDWNEWESYLVSVNKQPFNRKRELEFSKQIALIENWYFENKSFFEENFILNNVNKIKDIETYIVHGEFDLICMPSAAYDLHKELKNSKLYFLSNVAHTQREWKISKKLVEITDLI